MAEEKDRITLKCAELKELTQMRENIDMDKYLLTDEEKANITYDILALSMVGIVGLHKTMRIFRYYKKWKDTLLHKDWENVD